MAIGKKWCCSQQGVSILCHSALTGPHLLAVLADVSVDLMEGTEHVELTGVKAGLLSQIGIHILITDGRQAVNVSIVPERRYTHTYVVRVKGIVMRIRFFLKYCFKVKEYEMLKVSVNLRIFGRKVKKYHRFQSASRLQHQQILR